ncbi:hypothetical protein Rhe02_14550 [Rhizocola hellebori]|uniref:Uncharacterized protein n=1 Tax=Rhizocola hellebori TaxID=1392758 RepID=A0A8J3VEW6_9ACTN|nr:hypothetical protein [Rhizocola hellebori]GIH03388.1 hypothetical protein Rhe02_14550 [Rhizocola hellebori]
MTIDPAVPATRTARPLVRKHPKRDKSNQEFDAFTRRILRAYAARVAAGDVEALRIMASLAAEAEAVTTLAVVGLRKVPYSWDAIGEALGVSRQAAQQRYGDRAERHTLDLRLIKAGLSVTVPVLAAVFADHHPGIPPAASCPGCGFRFSAKESACPSMAVVRPLLRKRYKEDPAAVKQRLTPDLIAELHGKTTHTNGTTRVAKAVQSARPAASPAHTAPTLFVLNGKD